MNKDFLPFYNSLSQEEKELFLEFSKEELIDHFIANLKNAESLLKRINNTIESIDKYKHKYHYDLIENNHLDKIIRMLEGENIEL